MRKKLPIGIDGFEKSGRMIFTMQIKRCSIKELLQNWGEVKLVYTSKTVW